ncbi:MAG: hypothetical protein AAF548_17140 [Actinomycetota bacterium]
MNRDDELRSRIGDLADARDIAPLSVDDVIARRSAGHNRRRLLAVAAAVLMLAGIAGVIAVLGDDDEMPDVAAEAEIDDASPTSAPVGDDPVSTTTLPLSTTTVGPFIGGDVGSTSIGVSGAEWVVPWGDGFLSVGRVFEPSDASWEDLVPNIREIFPQEIADAVDASGETTAEGQMGVLEDAGLLESATEIFMANPEVMAAYDEIQSGGSYRSLAQISEDGITWTELPDFSLPGDNVRVRHVRSDGERLVVMTQTWTEEASSAEVAVSVTTDLEAWTTFGLPSIERDVPSHVQVDQYANGIALGPDGWYATLGSSTWVDIWALIPEATRTEMVENGYSYEAGADGISIVSWGDAPAAVDSIVPTTTAPVAPPETTVPATTILSGPIPSTTTTVVGGDAVVGEAPINPVLPDYEDRVVVTVIPWSDLPLTYEVYRRYFEVEQEGVFAAWTGTWDGQVSEAISPQGYLCCSTIGTDAGFVVYNTEGGGDMQFSADGQTWSPVAVPAAVDWISAAYTVDGGVVIVDGLGAAWRGDADATNWQAVSLEGLPEGQGLWYGPQHGRGVAAVLDVTVYDYSASTDEPVPFEATFAQDGLTITVVTDNRNSGTVTIVDDESGEVLLAASAGSLDVEPDFIEIQDDEYRFLDADGEVIVVVPMQEFIDTMAAAQDAAEAEAPAAEPEPLVFEPDYWLVASVDGISWHVEDLEEIDGVGYGDAAVNGDVVVVRDWNGGWISVAIG